MRPRFIMPDSSQFLLPFQGSVSSEQRPRSLRYRTQCSLLKSGSQLLRKSERLHHRTGHAIAVCRTFEMTYVWLDVGKQQFSVCFNSKFYSEFWLSYKTEVHYNRFRCRKDVSIRILITVCIYLHYLKES
jgi:hypothetical protein